MPTCKQFSRIDTAELKSQLYRKLGHQRAEKYFYNLKRLLNLRLSKLEFEKLCYSIIGKENLALHNLFIRSILSNAGLALAHLAERRLLEIHVHPKCLALAKHFLHLLGEEDP